MPARMTAKAQARLPSLIEVEMIYSYSKYESKLEEKPAPVASDNSAGGGDDESGTGTAIISKPKAETKTPPLYRVIILNDDFTPMDFVIHVLQKFFQKEYTEATRIMLQVHSQGAGTCGVFTFEIAETKVYLVNQYAKQNKHPLKCTMERA